MPAPSSEVGAPLWANRGDARGEEDPRLWIGSKLEELHERKWTLGCVMPLLGLAHVHCWAPPWADKKMRGEEDPKR